MSGYLRHEDDTEIQPVPRIPQESELAHAETPGQDLDEGLESVNAGERVPGARDIGLKIKTTSDEASLPFCLDGLSVHSAG